MALAEELDKDKEEGLNPDQVKEGGRKEPQAGKGSKAQHADRAGIRTRKTEEGRCGRAATFGRGLQLGQLCASGSPAQ